MNSQKESNSILIIADDFTGANDSGVQLAKKGATANVIFNWYDWQDMTLSQPGDVLIINTDSRAVSPQEAAHRQEQVVKQSPLPALIYKKIDSTLRGNIGAETSAILSTTQLPIAIVVPAFPAMGRTTKNGTVYINNVELLKTEFATDPKTPVHSSRIKEVILQQTDLACGEVFLPQIRSLNLKQELEKQIQDGKKIIVFDAEQDSDLKQIMQSVNQLNHPYLLVGSAGLIDHLPVQYQPKQQTTTKSEGKSLLVIAGSMSHMTQQQIDYTQTHGKGNWQIVDIDIHTLLPKYQPSQLEKYSQQIQTILQNSDHCIVRTCRDSSLRDFINQLCQTHHLSRTELGEHISDFLGQLTKHVASHLEFGGLFLTGGDIAIAVAQTMGAKGFSIQGEVSSGVPYGQLLTDKSATYRVFTKAGGFGSQDIFIKTLEFI